MRVGRQSVGMMLALALAPAVHAAPFFFDDFSGAGLDGAIWDGHAHDGSITVSGGWAKLITSASVLDFPYVITLDPIFPASGDVALEVRFRYPSVAGKGTGLVVLDADNDQVTGFWQDSASGLGVAGYVSGGGGLDTTAHTVRWEFEGGVLETYLDGVLRDTGSYADRPETLWFGHPSLGDVLYRNPSRPAAARVNADGTVTSRWWSEGLWTQLSIDYIKVERLGGASSSVPEPATALLLGVFAPALLAARRRRAWASGARGRCAPARRRRARPG